MTENNVENEAMELLVAQWKQAPVESENAG